MSENGITQAERRVREMDRMARQYTEQGNRFMNMQSGQTGHNGGNGQNVPPPRNPQNMRNSQNIPQRQQPRFEPVRQDMPTRTPPEPPKPLPEPTRTAEIPQPQGGFKLDGEKLLIMLILYILIKEKTDIKLIIALGYLLL